MSDETPITEEELGDRLEAMVDRTVETIVDLRAELYEANSLLRSAYQIAARSGRETNWLAFINQLEDALARQHKIIYNKGTLNMDGLTEGRIVHYVPSNSAFNSHRAAVITKVWNKEGTVNLYIFPDGSFQMKNLTPTSVMYNAEGVSGTWHWIEKA